MLEEKDYKRIKKELDLCKRPFYLFHDDPDGLCSFLQLYDYKKEGKGVPVKARPVVDGRFMRSAINYSPDKIFIVDLAIVEQEFIDEVKTPIVWIDHHEPLKRHGVKYFNPNKNSEHEINIPVSKICYNVVNNEKKIWVAACGTVGDWVIDKDIMKTLKKVYPDIVNTETDNPGELIHDTELGKLIRIMSFILKGSTSDVNKCVKVMTRIEDPYEILQKSTPRGKFIYKRFAVINKMYEKLLKEAESSVGKDPIINYIYQDGKISFTADLSNEMLYRHPEKVTIIGRRKSGEVKCSLRSNGKVIIRDILKEALKGVEGYGGGHEFACGACIKEKDFEMFIKQFKEGVESAGKKKVSIR